MHRIPHGKDQVYSADRPVVFLMHGLLAASNCYVALGPEKAPAYNLADAGFDVWMGNARGNTNSRHHVSLNPDDKKEKGEFFDFSWEEIALYDLPAMIDYTLASTNKEKLHYIGHSQGGTAFLVLNSMNTKYNKKIESAHLWAGVGYQNHFPNSDLSQNMAVLGGLVELFPPEQSEVRSSRHADNCVGNVAQKYLCQLMEVSTLLGQDTKDAEESSSLFDNYDPAGAALKQIAHYGQNIRDKSFARWSYGSIQNLFIYGSRNPPKYDLSLITIKVTMHYTVNDNLLDERDVLSMANDMPNTTVRKVARETFLHEDFVAASDAKELVTEYVIEALKRDSGLH
ncbi:putative lysosomal acid lipase [Operophtera brumata]|uniref:Putative lysosomal acid lipase n=1 Tax=Operophtera brumata TaxID=104452 RepID=A0A0L7L567_OPEBR|nr:putative lysosomal acid lipase [Operophtera brumata]